MNYNKLVERLRRCSEFKCRVCEYYPETACRTKLNEEAADAIEELSSENKSLAKSVNQASDILRRRRIPVGERLPEPPEEVEE